MDQVIIIKEPNLSVLLNRLDEKDYSYNSACVKVDFVLVQRIRFNNKKIKRQSRTCGPFVAYLSDPHFDIFSLNSNDCSINFNTCRNFLSAHLVNFYLKGKILNTLSEVILWVEEFKKKVLEGELANDTYRELSLNC